MKTLSPKSREGYKSRECLRFARSKRSLTFVFSTKLLIFVCFLFPQSWSSDSQQPPSASTEPGAAAAPANSSTILITASFKDGTPIEISRSDIEIEADGKPAPVEEVVTGAPLHYCLLFDSSVSQQDRFKLQQDEAIELLSKVVKDGSDRGMLVDFSDNYYLDGEGSNLQKFANHIAAQRPEGRGTSLYDAVIASANHMSKSAADRGARVMFIFSHGEDNESSTNLERAIQFAVKARNENLRHRTSPDPRFRLPDALQVREDLKGVSGENRRKGIFPGTKGCRQSGR
jgi:hypothetical protein